jgi:hypothetical protein
MEGRDVSDWDTTYDDWGHARLVTEIHSLGAERDRLQSDLARERTQREMIDSALHDTITERDRLREAIDASRPSQLANLKTLTAERDRLRAVAVAAQMVLTVVDSTPLDQVVDGVTGNDEIALLREKLAGAVAPHQLDATEGS